MNKLILGIVLIVILTVVGGYMYFTRTQSTQNALNNTTNLDQANSNSTPSSTQLDPNSNTLVDPNGVFTVLYPADYESDVSDPIHPRLFKRGETQRTQTEMYDGALIVFEPVDLENQTLSSWIDERIADATQTGMQEVINPKTAASFNNYPGYTYTLRGLGETTYTVIQKDTNSENAVVISSLVADPDNKGYQEEVNSTLNSITLLK